MADKKISQLTGATTPLAGSEVLPVVQGGSTVKVSVDNLTAGKAVTASQYKVVSTTGTTEALLDMQTAWSSPSGNKSLVWKDATNTLGRVSVDYTAPTARMAFGSLFNSGYQTANLLEISGDGNVKVNAGNLQVGTAAKGIDFSANTGLAGETSSLLNWYEEGTWTPVITSATGTITSTSVTAGKYTRIGRQVTASVSVEITDAGTGNGALLITLPYTSASASVAVGAAVEVVSTGDMGRAYVPASETNMYVTKYDNGTFIVTNYKVIVSVTYIV